MKIIEFGLPGFSAGDPHWSDLDGLQWRVSTDFHGGALPENVGSQAVALNKVKHYSVEGIKAHVEVSRDHGLTWCVLS